MFSTGADRAVAESLFNPGTGRNSHSQIRNRPLLVSGVFARFFLCLQHVRLTAIGLRHIQGILDELREHCSAISAPAYRVTSVTRDALDER